MIIRIFALNEKKGAVDQRTKVLLLIIIVTLVSDVYTCGTAVLLKHASYEYYCLYCSNTTAIRYV